jgi:Nucleotide modification associated domain 3
MKIILSRKGFDSSLGKIPSPIFPSGEFCSLPIPESMPDNCSTRYEEIKVGERSLGDIVNDLTQGKFKGDARAHLDPDLNGGSISRQKNWKPVFGQAGAAESHLQN